MSVALHDALQNMKTVRDGCELQPNALSIRLSDQIEQLDELIDAEGDGAAFFEKTHITQGMQDLITEGLARLAGALPAGHLPSEAVDGRRQDASAGRLSDCWPSIPSCARNTVRERGHATAFDTAAVAAFNGRNNPDHFFWGEIANQLGKGDQFRAFWTGGPKAPDEKDWLKLFDGDQPILILLDEMPPYFHYLDTQKVGNGTVADIATRAFANLLTAAGKKKNVCVVVSDLAAAYDTGTKLINRASGRRPRRTGSSGTEHHAGRSGRQRNLRHSPQAAVHPIPDQAEIEDIAEAFGRKLEDAAKSKTASRGAEAIADEIAATYPFHPRLKNVVALFKENEHFKQTRGLIELVSRSAQVRMAAAGQRRVPDRPAALRPFDSRGPRQADRDFRHARRHRQGSVGCPSVRPRPDHRSADGQGGRHAGRLAAVDRQPVHRRQCGPRPDSRRDGRMPGLAAARTVRVPGRLRGTRRVGLVPAPHARGPLLLRPAGEPDEAAAEPGPRAQGTPEVDDLIRRRLREMFKPVRKTCYDEVLPLPKLEEVANRVRKGRVLLIVSPDSKIPPEEVQKFFDGLTQKNNLCVLTGDKTAMGSVEKAACHLYAAQKADGRIPEGHPQRADLERKQQTYEHDFTSTILNLFDKVLFPIQRAGRPPNWHPNRWT
jgi:hypothetical protein